MEFFSGLDVGMDEGMDETSICVVDDKGKLALEAAVITDPEAIKLALQPYLGRLRRVGHAAGALSPWLHPELLKLGLPAVCLETQHVRSALSAQRNKTDAADALGIAHIMRTGWFRKGAYQERVLLLAAAVVDAAAQPETQGAGSGKHHSALAQGLRHSLARHRSGRL
jgi:transposase